MKAQIKKWCKLAKSNKASNKGCCTCKFVLFGRDTSGNFHMNLKWHILYDQYLAYVSYRNKWCSSGIPIATEDQLLMTTYNNSLSVTTWLWLACWVIQVWYNKESNRNWPTVWARLMKDLIMYSFCMILFLYKNIKLYLSFM